MEEKDFRQYLNELYGSAGKYEDNFLGGFFGRPKTKFVPTQEAKEILKEYSEKIGRDMKISPMSNEQFTESQGVLGQQGASGLFQPKTPDTVYLGDDVDMTTLVHELKHAEDPKMNLDNAIKFAEMYSLGPIADNIGLEGDPNALHYFDKDNRTKAFEHYSSDPLRTFEAELLAEKEAADYAKNKGKEYFRPIDAYPGDYIRKFMNRATTSKGLQDYGALGETKYTPAVRRYQHDNQQLQEELQNDPEFTGAVNNFFDSVRNIRDNYIKKN